MLKSKILKYKSFESWLQQEVDKEFGLNQLFDDTKLVFYTSNLPSLTASEQERTEDLRTKLATMNPSWNEFDNEGERI